MYDVGHQGVLCGHKCKLLAIHELFSIRYEGNRTIISRSQKISIQIDYINTEASPVVIHGLLSLKICQILQPCMHVLCPQSTLICVFDRNPTMLVHSQFHISVFIYIYITGPPQTTLFWPHWQINPASSNKVIFVLPVSMTIL